MAVLSVATAMAVSLLVCALAVRFGARLGLADHPDGEGLKIHRGGIVALGGAGLLAGIHTGLAIAGLFDPALLGATVLVFAVGVVDDRRGLGPIVRLGVFAAAGVVLAVTAESLRTPISIVVAVIMVVVTINAVNLFDGLDGLAGSVVAVGALGLSSMAAKQGLMVPWAGVVVAAALVGFLLFNLPPARLFLGDNGAYVAGVTLAWLALRVSEDWSAGAVALAAVGIPVLDLAVAVVRRLRAGVPLFGGDRDHTYDRLHRRGWSPGRVTSVLTAAQVGWSTVVVGTAILMGDRPAAVMAALLGLGVVAWLGLRDGRPEPAPG